MWDPIPMVDLLATVHPIPLVDSIVMDDSTAVVDPTAIVDTTSPVSPFSYLSYIGDPIPPSLYHYLRRRSIEPFPLV